MGSGLGILCDPSALCGAAFQEGKHNRKDCLTCDPFLSLQSVTFSCRVREQTHLFFGSCFLQEDPALREFSSFSWLVLKIETKGWIYL